MTFFNKYVKGAFCFTLIVLMMLSFAACSKGESQNDETAVSSVADEDKKSSVTTTALSVSEPETDAKYTIGVLLCGDSKDDKAAYSGFLTAFEQRDFEQNGVHHNIILSECKDGNELKTKASEFVSQHVDLIYAVGEKAAIAAARATASIPIVFCNVADPIEAGLLSSASAPDKNVTGVSDFTPCKEQIEFIKTLYPKAKKISAVYCATDENSILVSNFAKIEAEAMKLEYNAFTASNKDQIKIAVEGAAKDGDVIYLYEDELTLSQRKTIFNTAKEKKVPVFSSTGTFIGDGAVATSLPDYIELGYDAGELALIILKELKPINEIAVEYPKACINYVNEAYLDKLPVDNSQVTVY